MNLAELLWPDGLGVQVALAVLAAILSAIVGAERQIHRKHAGLRTHILVGTGAAIFTLVSAHGFAATVEVGAIMDPSRIAAQIVSGVGFLGAGVIFVRQEIVSGLTTAASIWMTAAIGMACGAGMPALAALGTAIHLVATIVIARLRSWVRARRGEAIRIVYKSGSDVLRNTLAAASELGMRTSLKAARVVDSTRKRPRHEALLTFDHGGAKAEQLIATVASLPGVVVAEAVTVDPD